MRNTRNVQDGLTTDAAVERAGTNGWNGASTTDQRTLTRRQKERARKARLFEERTKRLANEQLVLTEAATGASFQEIATHTGMSKTTVSRLYHSAMDRIEAQATTEYRKSAMHSLGVLKQAAFRHGALAGDPRLIREARELQDQMNRLMGAYPPAQVDLGGEVTMRRELSVREAATIVARIQASRLIAGEVEMPELIMSAPNDSDIL